MLNSKRQDLGNKIDAELVGFDRGAWHGTHLPVGRALTTHRVAVLRNVMRMLGRPVSSGELGAYLGTCEESKITYLLTRHLGAQRIERGRYALPPAKAV